MKNYKDFNLRKNMIHQPPMLMVDEILCENSMSGKTLFRVHKDCIFLNSRGVLQRTAMIEIAAQSFAAIDIFQKKEKGLKYSKGFIAGIRDFQFFSDAKIDDEIICNTEKIDELGQLYITKADLINKKTGEVLAKGEIRIYEML
ncbi:MAG: hypothetical protein LBQ37_04670 [Elusimicrobiota bacterium]|jgi:predicted hotdog family 3-hydroxylacyl-ACP dehydratase|nr:hypothetical protein [Elusimicrobiota bacterium]